MRKVRLLPAIPLALALVWLGAGCEKNPNAPARVSGTVKYKDQLVKGGKVEFQAHDGGKYSAPITPQGTYTMTDLPVGEVVVTVETESVKPNQRIPVYGAGQGAGGRGTQGGGARGQMQPPPANAPPAQTGEYVEIPKKYADPKTTTLKTSLNKGDNKYDIVLE
jgi:hypothetical protein